MSILNAIVADCRISLKKLARTLHRDQRGTSLTEFVICLPIFILVFAGVVNLNKLQRKGMALKIEATREVWTKAIPVQKKVKIPHMSTTTQAILYTTNSLNHITHPRADLIDLKSGVNLGTHGHFGESYAMVNPIDSYADFDFELEKNGKDVYDDQPLAKDLLTDNARFEFSGGSLVGQLAGLVLNLTGSRPAIGAGIRYGVVYGDVRESITVANKTYNMGSSYNVLVAPQPTLEIITTAITRLSLESHDDFSNLLGIEQDDRL